MGNRDEFTWFSGCHVLSEVNRKSHGIFNCAVSGLHI